MTSQRKRPGNRPSKRAGRNTAPRKRHAPGGGERAAERVGEQVPERPGSRPNSRPGSRPGSHPDSPAASAGGLWLFGVHAVLAALANPRRRKERLLVGRESARRHGAELERLLALPAAPAAEQAGRDDFLAVLPESAVHQGLALRCAPLAQPALEDLLAAPPDPAVRPVILLLDQVTDPHNVGAILRSAAAFGARAVVTTGRNAAPESGVLAKTASGALDHIPYVSVTNLARALESLKAAGYWTLGLAGEGRRSLAEANPEGPVALVLGAEGGGLRRLTRETCDELVRLPTREPISALNVSNAAAVALYELLG